jgi:hypothetical protein
MAEIKGKSPFLTEWSLLPEQVMEATNESLDFNHLRTPLHCSCKTNTILALFRPTVHPFHTAPCLIHYLTLHSQLDDPTYGGISCHFSYK